LEWGRALRVAGGVACQATGEPPALKGDVRKRAGRRANSTRG
jgi:hypothetical protein